MLNCKDSRDYQIIKTLRSHGWSRETSNGTDSIYKHKKDKYLDPKFTFCNSGYNLRPTEACAAIALSQLKRLNKIKKLRTINYNKLKSTLENSKIYTDDDRMKIRDCLKIIISGQTLDLKRFTGASEKSMIGLRNEKELDEYTYMVAGCVGEFWTHMTLGHQFKLNQEKEDVFFTKAVSFGKALQLINILRDLPEDLRMGRCYIPIEELSKHDLVIEDLLEIESIIKFKPIFDSYIDKTDNYLDEAIEYIEMIPKYQFRLRLSCMLPVIIGQKTLNLLRNGNILDSNNRIKVDRSEIKKVVRRAAIASISKKNSLKLLKKYK